MNTAPTPAHGPGSQPRRPLSRFARGLIHAVPASLELPIEIQIKIIGFSVKDGKRLSRDFITKWLPTAKIYYDPYLPPLLPQLRQGLRDEELHSRDTKLPTDRRALDVFIREFRDSETFYCKLGAYVYDVPIPGLKKDGYYPWVKMSWRTFVGQLCRAHDEFLHIRDHSAAKLRVLSEKCRIKAQHYAQQNNGRPDPTENSTLLNLFVTQRMKDEREAREKYLGRRDEDGLQDLLAFRDALAMEGDSDSEED
ncbi:hypothetical protein MNV49_006038 [Pseudohyphozyma bogoriensis]|nr:hypothetical protein MNV49_006038 [Pseudohyphozyma bogoriensis]